jgi:hypothetical protein
MEVVHKKKQPCNYVVATSKSKTKLMLFAKEFNHGKELRAADRLKPALIDTLSRLVFLLAKEYLKPHFNYFLKQENNEGYMKGRDLALPHTKSYIANYSQKEGDAFKIVSTSTVRNHLKKLQSFGLIKLLPENSKTLILIHPDLIHFSSKFKHLDEQFRQFFDYPLENLYSGNREFQENNTQTLPPKYPNLETLNSKTVSDVHNIKGIESDDYETSCLETPKTKHPVTNGTETKEKSSAKKESTKREKYIEKSIVILWSWIMQHLYTKDIYSYVSESQKEYFETYMNDCYGNSSQSPNAIHSNIQLRLDVWNNWLRKDRKNRFTPLPSNFFKYKDIKGFDKTHSWLKSKKNREKESADRAKAKNFYRKFVRIQEDKDLTMSEKLKAQKKLYFGMNQVAKTNPAVLKEFKQAIEEYYNGINAA